MIPNLGFIWVIFDRSKLDGPPAEVISQKERSTPVEVANGYIGSTDVRLSLADRGRPADVITLTSEQYLELSDLLINKTDFAGIELAVKSTREWIDKVKELSGASKVGVSVEGQLPLQPDHRPSEDQAAAQGSGTISDMVNIPPVNILRAVKKRKRVSDGRGEENPTTNDLAHGLVKINDQPGAQAAPQATSSDAANLLSTNLVRKKSKLQL
ncbi:hypothetical protein LTR64_007697 [Lithohypha guttulata]|uniref:uncharacterized protein n=1 Tax=Lithohypha guttulata TaxID=1690604 RepID=UPI002DDEDC5F|nr:hypothetical protein LTR51_007206 [Lithohypha guttulata]